ncbi:MAG: CPBP family glutamic-type intramembrane protease [Actinomycetaceae bacterium]|nr:CPBP family glutamic-type intramembrane protease [Actinomycetaceae bacterium]
MSNITLKAAGFIVAYYVLSAIGFATLHAFGITYIDDRIIWAALPMMLILAALAYYAQSNRTEMFNLRQLRFTWDHTPLFLVPFLTVATVIAALIESIVHGSFSILLIAAVLLALLIGFAEEAMFRRFILELPGENPSIAQSVGIFFLSVITFAGVHMMNVFSDMSLYEAFQQSLYTINFGVISALLYMVTKNFLALVFWHMATDFGLFTSQLGIFQSPALIGQVIDIVMWVSTGLSVVYGGLRLYRRFRLNPAPAA